MKTLKELRNNPLMHNKQEGNLGFIKYLNKKQIDFDVYLPNENIWKERQKQELIMSILLMRFIPHISIIVIYDNEARDEIYQIIDGKQRLRAMIDFFNNKFPLIFDNKEYLFKDLPKDYRVTIECYDISAYIIHNEIHKPISDSDKLEWFKLTNFNTNFQAN